MLKISQSWDGNMDQTQLQLNINRVQMCFTPIQTLTNYVCVCSCYISSAKTCILLAVEDILSQDIFGKVNLASSQDFKRSFQSIRLRLGLGFRLGQGLFRIWDSWC